MDVFVDIQTELEAFFKGLNWTYIFIYTMVLYGIKHKQEFVWYNKLLKRWNITEFKTWLAGITVGIFFCLFATLGNKMCSEYVSTLLRSWILVIVFNSFFDKKISQAENRG